MALCLFLFFPAIEAFGAHIADLPEIIGSDAPKRDSLGSMSAENLCEVGRRRHGFCHYMKVRRCCMSFYNLPSEDSIRNGLFERAMKMV
jgi:hypothetical protein